MSIPTRPSGTLIPESSGTFGLVRTSLAGPGQTLPDAFSRLEHASLVERVTRHFSRNLLGARVVLAADEGRGYWDFTRIRDECYVIIQNYAYKERRFELNKRNQSGARCWECLAELGRGIDSCAL